MNFEKGLINKVVGESPIEQYENSERELFVDDIIMQLSDGDKKKRRKDESYVDSVLSRDEETNSKAREILKRHFCGSYEEIEKHLKMKEFKKSEDQVRIIEFVNIEANNVMEKYGVEKFDISPDNIHLYSREDFNILFQNKRKDLVAFYSPLVRAVIMNQSGEGYNRAAFAHYIFHEFMHFHQCLEIFVRENVGLNPDESDDKVHGRCRVGQNGMTIMSYKIENQTEHLDNKGRGEKSREMVEIFFGKLQEAIAEELSIRFHKNILISHPEFEKDRKLFEEYLKQEQKKGNITSEISEGESVWFRKKVTLSPDNRKKFEKIEAAVPPYKAERKILNNLIDKLFDNNQDKFKDREEVFDLFAKSIFTGNIVGKESWGRLLDETFGEGMLRGLMEADSSLKKLKDLREFVDNLPNKNKE